MLYQRKESLPFSFLNKNVKSHDTKRLPVPEKSNRNAYTLPSNVVAERKLIRSKE